MVLGEVFKFEVAFLEGLVLEGELAFQLLGGFAQLQLLVAGFL